MPLLPLDAPAPALPRADHRHAPVSGPSQRPQTPGALALPAPADPDTCAHTGHGTHTAGPKASARATGPHARVPASATDLCTPTAGPDLSRPASPTTRRVLSLLPLLLLGVWAAVDLKSLREGTARLAAADPRWLLAGLVFTALGWVAAACMRQGAVTDRLPKGALLASQIAAGAANNLLPAGIGAHAVTVRFLRRQGVALPRATASVALYSVARAVAKTPLLLVFVLVAPTTMPPARLLPDGETLLLAGAGLLCVLAAAAAVPAVLRRLRRPMGSAVRTALRDARHLHTRPGRFLPLWGGAVATPLLQGCVVASVGSALGVPLSWPQMVFAFLAAGTAAGAVPAPGGIGPVDAALILVLVGYGTPLTLATATAVGYRVLTVWVPLLPGMLLLSAMMRRGRL